MMSPPKQLLCPVTGEIMQHPVILAPCGHSCDRASVGTTTGADHTISRRCPLCQTEVGCMVPSAALQEMLEEWGSRRGSFTRPPSNGTLASLKPTPHSHPEARSRHHRDSFSGPPLRQTSVPYSPLQGKPLSPLQPHTKPFATKHLPITTPPRAPLSPVSFPSSPQDPIRRRGTLTAGSGKSGSFGGAVSSARLIRERTSSLSAFTFGSPAVTEMMDSPSASWAGDEDQDLQSLRDQLHTLEAAGRRNSMAWTEVNRRVDQITARRMSEFSDTLSFAAESRRTSAVLRRDSSPMVGDSFRRPSELRPLRLGSVEGGGPSNAYTIALQALRKEEVVWSTDKGTRRTHQEQLKEFLHGFKRFVRSLHWTDSLVPQTQFLRDFRLAIDSDALQPEGVAQVVLAAFELWEGETLDKHQLGRVLQLRALPSTLPTFHHLLEDVSHAQCPVTCAGRRYHDHRVAELASGANQRRNDVETEALRLQRDLHEAERPAPPSTEDPTAKLKTRRDKVAGLLASTSRRVSSAW